MEFIDKMTEIMRKKGISAYKLCNDTKMSESSVRNWKKGSLPTIDKLKTLALYLNVSSDELLGIEKENELPQDETKLLEDYRSADHRGKEAILETADREARRQRRDKERS